MKIGELARRALCPVETVRYYEKTGLLHAPLRDSVNNYRHYDNSHLEKLLFIRRCRSLDMTHEEIRALLDATHHQDQTCGPVDAIIRSHLTHVQHRIDELKVLEQQLQELLDGCSADRRVEECGIFQQLSADETAGGQTYPLDTRPGRIVHG